MENEFIIYSRQLAYELRLEGFKILRVEINPYKPQFDCYIFENTDAFQSAFSRLSKLK